MKLQLRQKTNLRNFLVKNGIKNKNIEVGTYSTGGVNIKFKKGGSKSNRKIQKGGVGYYLAINDNYKKLQPLITFITTSKKIKFKPHQAKDSLWLPV